jgi:hypothetical protein
MAGIGPTAGLARVPTTLRDMSKGAETGKRGASGHSFGMRTISGDHASAMLIKG